MRILSVVCLLAPVIAGVIWPDDGLLLGTMVYSIMAASLLLALQPIADERPGMWLVFSGLILLVETVFFIVDFHPALYVTVCLMLSLLYNLIRFFERCSLLRELFKPQSVWSSLEFQMRLMLSFCAGLCAIPVIALGRCPWAAVPLVLLAIAFYVLMYYRSVSGRSLILGIDKERTIKQMIRNADDISCEALKGMDADDMERMQALYGRILKILENGQPFLDPDYSLQDLASAAFTNKTYISRTINTISGKNFRQFVNCYRVQYAVELLRADPRLTVGQLAEMSGFNSSVTFSMAFKLNMGETPGEYSIRLRSGLV